MNVQFLLGPLLGALIGGITNGIAIKMLFRPLKPIKIGGWTLPFTPGVIPKERERIASKVGEVVSKELLNEEVLREWLLKEEIKEEIKKGVHHYLDNAQQDHNTINDKLAQMLGEERTTFIVCEAEELVTEKVYTRLVKMALGKVITQKFKERLKEGQLGSLLGPMSFFINDSIIEGILDKIEPFITQFVEEEGEAVIRQAVEEESKSLLSVPVSELAQKAVTYEESISQIVLNGYTLIVEEHMKTILQKLNVSEIVRQRILSIDMLEMEKIILSIMHKELRAIIGFGVLLGAIMGLLMNSL